MATATGTGQGSPNAADGATVTGLATRIAGKDGSGNNQDVIVDSDGHLQIDLLSTAASEHIAVDSNNTTTSLLNSGIAFTGTATDLVTDGKSNLFVSVFSDKDSAASGLVIQFSQDGTNWPTGSYKHTFTISANVARTFQLGSEARFFRVVYTNGGTNQTVFRLTTILTKTLDHQTLHRIDDAVIGDRSVLLNKTVLVAKKPNNDYVNIEATAGGNLKSSIEEIDAGALPIRVEGQAADGDAVADKPVRIAGKDGGGLTQDLMTDASGVLATTTKVTASDAHPNDRLGLVVSNASEGELLRIAGAIFNGGTWDRQRGNVNATALASAARTASADSGDIVNYNGRGIQVVVDVTVDPASASFTTQIQVKDIISGKYITVLTSVAINGVGTTRLTVYPGITVAANVSVSDLISRTWRVTTTHVDGDSITYSIGASIIL